MNVGEEDFIVSQYCDMLFKYRYLHRDKKYRGSPGYWCIIAGLFCTTLIIIITMLYTNILWHWLAGVTKGASWKGCMLWGMVSALDAGIMPSQGHCFVLCLLSQCLSTQEFHWVVSNAMTWKNAGYELVMDWCTILDEQQHSWPDYATETRAKQSLWNTVLKRIPFFNLTFVTTVPPEMHYNCFWVNYSVINEHPVTGQMHLVF